MIISINICVPYFKFTMTKSQNLSAFHLEWLGADITELTERKGPAGP